MAKFLLLKPTKAKIGVSLITSLIFMVVILAIPTLGRQAVFLKSGLLRQILDCIVGFIAGSVMYYPLACGFVYVFRVITGKEKVQAFNLMPAVLFIVMFNPITLSIVYMGITKNNQTKETPCGLLIAEVVAPTAKNAGLVAGEVIRTVNGYPAGDMAALTHALADKRPNDTVTVTTNANTYNVTLSSNPQTPRQVALGIKVKTIECGK